MNRLGNPTIVVNLKYKGYTVYSGFYSHDGDAIQTAIEKELG